MDDKELNKVLKAIKLQRIEQRKAEFQKAKAKRKAEAQSNFTR